MKKVLVSIRNGLMSEAIVRALKAYGDFSPCQFASGTGSNLFGTGETEDADIVLMEISYLPGTTVEARLNDIGQIRSNNPKCKVAVLCDDNAAPELAHKVTQLKKDRLIDNFFYTSVTANYLTSTLAAL